MKFNKKGQLGMDTGKAFLLGLMGLLLIGVVVAIVLASLGATTVVTGNTDATNIVGNGTAALSTFFASTGTWLALLGVVIIMLIIAVVVAVVNRFGSNRV